MTYHGIFGEFILETILWKKMQPFDAVERAVRLWFDIPLLKSALLPSCSMTLTSFSLLGTPFCYQPTQMTASDTAKPPPASDKVFMRARGPQPQSLRLDLLRCWHCLHFFSRHLPLMYLCVQSDTRHSAGKTEVTDAIAPGPCRKGRHRTI